MTADKTISCVYLVPPLLFSKKFFSFSHINPCQSVIPLYSFCRQRYVEIKLL